MHAAAEERPHAGIRAVDVVKCYGEGGVAAVALNGFSLSVSGGEIVSLTGISGSGKSTLLGILAGLVRADSGEISVAGTDLSAISERELYRYRRENVSLVFQEYNLLGMLTVAENIGYVGRLTARPASEFDPVVAACMRELGLQDLSGRYPAELSGGQRQRVAIARAIAGQRLAGKQVLLADEPTGSLDLDSTRQVMAAFRSAADAGIAVLVATHDPVVTGLSDRMLSIRDGRNFDVPPGRGTGRSR